MSLGIQFANSILLVQIALTEKDRDREREKRKRVSKRRRKSDVLMLGTAYWMLDAGCWMLNILNILCKSGYRGTAR